MDLPKGGNSMNKGMEMGVVWYKGLGKQSEEGFDCAGHQPGIPEHGSLVLLPDLLQISQPSFERQITVSGWGPDIPGSLELIVTGLLSQALEMPGSLQPGLLYDLPYGFKKNKN